MAELSPETRMKIEGLAGEVMDIVGQVAARRLSQSLQFVYEDRIKPLSEMLEYAQLEKETVNLRLSRDRSAEARADLEWADKFDELQRHNRFLKEKADRLEKAAETQTQSFNQLLELLKRVEQRWKYDVPVVEQALREEMRTALGGG